MFSSYVGSEVARLLAAPAVAALVSVLEDDRLLFPNDTNQGYRRTGRGVFELRGDRVAFSTTDGSDPNTNGRTYSLFLPDTKYADAVSHSISRRIAADDREMAALIIESTAINNNLLGNFFTQLDPVLDLLRDHDLSIGRRMAIIGCGETPWAPARLLAEGAEQVIANDLLPVSREWDAEALAEMVQAVQRISPRLSPALEARLDDLGDGTATFRGLETVGGQRFEELPIEPASLDFIFSTSVLEHVDQPNAVYAAMARALKPGAATFHSVDLRDHRDFSKPLAFLELSEEEYAAHATENRLRCNDHLELAARHGLRVERVIIQALLPDDDPNEAGWYHSYEEVVPALAPEVVERFDPMFRHRDPRDLSVICLQYLAVREEDPN